MGHGTVADEIKGRAAQFAGERSGAILAIEEEGVRFRSYLDGSTRFMGPETSMEVQAALGSDIALVFDECTPFHADREYTARSTERTHRWLDRCLAWHAAARARGPDRLRHRPGRHRRGPAPLLRPGGRRPRGARRDRDRRLARRGQGADVRGRRVDDRGAAGGQAAPPAGDRRGRRPRARRRARHRHLRLRDADPHRPPRHGARARPGEALARGHRQGALARGRRAAARGLPVPGLRRGLLARVPALPASRPRSRPRCACSRSTTSPTCSA